VTWVIIVAVWAWRYVADILAGPRLDDAYAYTVEFQLLAFALVRLPWALLMLAAGLAAVFLLTRREQDSEQAR
jgi:hypothetical protein